MSRILARQPRRVLLAAALFVVAAGAIGGKVQQSLTYGPANFEDAGSQSARAEHTFQAVTGSHPNSTLIALVDVPSGVGTLKAKRRVGEVARLLRGDPAVVRVLSYYETGDRSLVSRNGRATYLVAGLRGVPELGARHAAERIERELRSDHDVSLGGQAVATSQFDGATQVDLHRAELVAAPIVLLLLFWVFRGVVAALMPLLVGILAITGGMLGLRIATTVGPLSVFALNVTTGLGLGLGVDYSLLMVSRFREELQQGLSPAEACRRTLATAGRTVFFSALTVAGALAALLVFPQPFLYSMGVAGIIVTVVAGAVALTVLPAALVALGPRIDALSMSRWRDGAGHRRDERFWRRVAAVITSHPRRSAMLAGALLVSLSIPLFSANFSFADARALPHDASARQVFERINAEFPPYRATPILVAIPRAGERRTVGRAQAAAVRRSLTRVPGVAAVEAPVVRRGEAVVRVYSSSDPKSAASRSLVRRLRASHRTGRILVGGDTATFVDLRTSVTNHLPVALAIVVLAVFLGQVPLTRSLILPLKTVLMSLFTVVATLGVLVLVFQDGHFQSLLGFKSEGSIGLAEPIVVMTLVVALTSDYAGFMLGRIREAHESGEPDAGAVASGLGLTGRTVTAAALILAVALGAFVTAENVYVKQLGLGVGVAVLLDAAIVRVLFVPSLMVLLGRWNWWLPAWLGRRLGARRVPSPAGAGSGAVSLVAESGAGAE